VRGDLEDYKLNTFENIVLEILYPNKSMIVSNIYRSPTPPPNLTVSDHTELFLNTLDSHLARLSELNKNVYVFTDSNINLLRLHDNPLCSDYLDTLILNGFIQIIGKATRIQHSIPSLIDHIFTNTNLTKYNAGTILDDLSDHFINYKQISPDKTHKPKQNPNIKRQITEMNMRNLKNALGHTDWAPVLSETTVDASFDRFWDIFKSLYDEHFPEISVKFNKNKHKINGYMTPELLEMHNRKLYLHKKALKTKTAQDSDIYKIHRNNYNTALRLSKQKYYAENLQKNIKNP
jgi:hypothetical protein